MSISLNQREAAVLGHVIETYLTTGEPVGSQVVAQAFAAAAVSLSSASIRNIMADLAAAGLLTQPHTSAGRVPTSIGLRYFVDCLVETPPLSEAEQQAMQAQYAQTEPELHAILGEASRLLARLSRYAGLVVRPARRELVFRQMQFVKLSGRRLLGIFVTREGVTQNRVIDVEQEQSYVDLERINNYCNAAFLGLTLVEARAKAAHELAVTQREVDDLLTRAMRYAAETLQQDDRDAAADLVVEGSSRLLECPEFAENPRTRVLLAALEERQQIAALLARVEESAEVQVFIGGESGYDALSECSVVVSSYHRGGTVLGTLGVIGPTRMAYGRVIPIVQCTAMQVSEWLGKQ